MNSLQRFQRILLRLNNFTKIGTDNCILNCQRPRWSFKRLSGSTARNFDTDIMEQLVWGIDCFHLLAGKSCILVALFAAGNCSGIRALFVPQFTGY
jgi:hypothetical protein